MVPPTYLSLAGRKLAPPTDDVHHLGQFMRRAVLGSTALVAVVGLPRAPRVLATTILDVDHTFLLVRGTELCPLAVHTVRGLPRTFVELAPKTKRRDMI